MLPLLILNVNMIGTIFTYINSYKRKKVTLPILRHLDSNGRILC